MSDASGVSIAITGLGLCSSLGGVVTACGAARAGLSASRALEDFLAMDENGFEDGVVGHPVKTLDGFQGYGRLFGLALAGLEDLLARHEIRHLDLHDTGFYLCLPEPTTRSPLGMDAPPKAMRLCGQLSEVASLQIPPSHWRCMEEGPTGFARAIEQACAELRAWRWKRCLIGAVDSLLDHAALERLAADSRLKTAVRPDGLQPGEAGAFILLERSDVARLREVDVMASVADVALTDEQPTNAPCTGAALAASIAKTLPADAGTSSATWLISDQNGETRRASELGHLLARLKPKFPALVESPIWMPAASFGDTGAASGGIAVCMAARSFKRGYGAAQAALVLSSSDGPARSALRIVSA